MFKLAVDCKKGVGFTGTSIKSKINEKKKTYETYETCMAELFTIS